MIKEIREKRPLIHQITNYVTANDCANITLAIGARPVMSDDELEVADVTAAADALMLNLGTLRHQNLPAMVLAGQTAQELHHPVLLDPVGAGGAKMRTKAALELLNRVSFNVIRGNMSEIKALLFDDAQTSGVDASPGDQITRDNLKNCQKLVMQAARHFHCVIAVSGAIDVVSDGEKTYAIYNGDPKMAGITGTGCMLSSLMTSFIAVHKDEILEAARAALCLMGAAGEHAASRLKDWEGSMALRQYLIDTIVHADDEWLKRNERYELLK